jgi:hypothetical protein
MFPDRRRPATPPTTPDVLPAQSQTHPLRGLAALLLELARRDGAEDSGATAGDGPGEAAGKER